MTRGFQGAVMRGFGARDHLATMHSKELLAPHFMRVRLSSSTLFQDVAVSPTAWLRFWFPDPDGGNTEFQRAYTITEANPETGEFAVDFVLHEPAGPASVWAQGAQHGDQIALTSLGSSKFLLPDELPAGYLLIGDSASIPAINSILAVLPGEVPVELYLEQHDGNDLTIPLTAHPRTRVHWVPRRGANSLAAALPARDWSDWYAWVGCESGSMKPLRQRLREEFGFPKSEVYLQAYWFEGRAMGKLRGTPPAATYEPDSNSIWITHIPAPGAELICHNDLAPWNLLIGERWVFIDWDAAAPSTRPWDLAYAAQAFTLNDASADPRTAARALAAFIDGYGADEELRAALPVAMWQRTTAMYELLRTSHDAGTEPWGTMFTTGHGDHWHSVTQFVKNNESLWLEAVQAVR